MKLGSSALELFLGVGECLVHYLRQSCQRFSTRQPLNVRGMYLVDL